MPAGARFAPGPRGPIRPEASRARKMPSVGTLNAGILISPAIQRVRDAGYPWGSHANCSSHPLAIAWFGVNSEPGATPAGMKIAA